MIPPDVRIFVCTAPQDFRRSFDGLAATARDVLAEDPRSGALFVFTNKRKNRLKCLWWDENGYCLLYKRIHEAVVRWPSASDPSLHIDGATLAQLLRGTPRSKTKSQRKEGRT